MVMAGLTGVRRGFVVGGQQRNAVLLGPVRQAQRVFHTAGVLHLEKVNIFTLTNELWPSSQAPCSFGPVCQAQRICVLHAAGVLHHAWFNKSLQMNKAHSNARHHALIEILTISRVSKRTRVVKWPIVEQQRQAPQDRRGVPRKQVVASILWESQEAKAPNFF